MSFNLGGTLNIYAPYSSLTTPPSSRPLASYLSSSSALTLSARRRPYFGQAAWFKLFHPEKIPSAIERYEKEILRVLQVLESVLATKEWLNGGKATIADIAVSAPSSPRK